MILHSYVKTFTWEISYEKFPGKEICFCVLSFYLYSARFENGNSKNAITE